MDFTLKTYKNLLQALKTRGFSFYTFSRYLQQEHPNEPKQQVILRHDVDLLPKNALQTAKIEHSLGIRSTYFFRIIPETFKPDIIQQIADVGHEIGYHYEDLTLAAESVGSSSGSEQSEENNDKKIQSWVRRIRPAAAGARGKRGSGKERSQRSEVGGQQTKTNTVETHGRAYTNYNSRASTNNRRYVIHRILKTIKSNKNKIGISEDSIPISERGFPFRGLRGARGQADLITHAYELFRYHLEQLRQYVPVKTICMHGSPKSKYDSKDLWKYYDYRKLGILGEPYFDIDFNEVFYLTDTGRRWDGWKVSLRDKVPQQEQWKEQGLVFHSTQEIIKAAENNQLPNKIMITTHPQRWTDRPVPWVKEFLWQNVKNVGKYFLVKLK